MTDPIRVAVVGSGNIGTDLCERLLLHDEFELVAFVGRRHNSPGIARLKGRIKHALADGIDSLVRILPEVDGIFDATSANSHRQHWMETQLAGKFAIDLTPSRLGRPFVPVLMNQAEGMQLSDNPCANYSMVTCGGQSSAPILYALARNSVGIQEVEVSSSIASLSAGPATRDNLDEYISATENMATQITGCANVKSILVLNPAEPPVMMRTTVHLRVEKVDLKSAECDIATLFPNVQIYVPGYELVVEPHLVGEGIVSATVKVSGAGYYLPEYSGNLDIINAAAVETARLHYRHSCL